MTASKIRDEVQTILLEQIRGSISSPRHFRTQNLESLARSIRQRGVLHPILVRPINSNLFEVVAGERRLLATRKAGLTDVPTRVRTYFDSGRDNEAPGDVQALEDALLENVQRERLSSLEVAEAVLEIVCLKLGETQAFVLERLMVMHNRSRQKARPNLDDDDDRILEAFDDLGAMSWRAFMARGRPLVMLPDNIKILILNRSINPYLARKLARADSRTKQQLIVQIHNGLTARNLCHKLIPRSERTDRFKRLEKNLKTKLENPNVQAALELLEQELETV
jgi:ParB family transcriptional regulator, chromosome partitioning protein